MGDVVAGARLGERLQGARGEFLGAAGVAVTEQEFGAGVPYLRAFQGFAEAFRELLGLGEEAFGVVTVAAPSRARPSACRLCRTPRASAISRRSRSASRWWCSAAAQSCLVSATQPRLARIVLWITRSRSASGRLFQQLQRLTESRLRGLDVAAEVFGGGHDAATAGAQVGI